MSDTQALLGRIESLEVRLAYQDQVIEELNQALTAQWAKIDGLARQTAALAERVKDTESAGGALAAQTKPPHY